MKTIGVCGITGSQGGSVGRELKKKGYNVIGITRNPLKKSCEELTNLGINIVKADFDEPETVKLAFKNCDVVYLMTNFWEHMSPKKEFKQAREIIDILKNTEVKHIIWSTLEDSRDFKDNIDYLGDYKIPHFDEKGMVSKYLNNQKIKSTHLYTSFFNENLIGMMKLKKANDGIRRLVLPMKDKLLPIVALEDIGKMVCEILKNDLCGDISVSSEHISCKDMAVVLSDVIGEPVYYVPIDANSYRNLGFPGCKDLGNMFEFKEVHNKIFCEKRNINKVKELISPISFKDWCIKNKSKLI